VSGELLLSDERTAVAILTRGGRVQSVRDRRSGRELLHQRQPTDPGGEFLDASTGGWDAMFHNDAAWEGHPDHGQLWAAGFQSVRSEPDSLLLATALERPAVELRRGYRLLPAPRTGLRVETTLRALDDTGPFLWACHVMVAVEPGWLVETNGERLRVDPVLPGRFAEGGAHPSAISTVPRPDAIPAVPRPRLGWAEVLYADAATRALVRSPDGRRRTLLTWGGGELSHLWVVTVTGEAGLDLAVVLEPSNSATWEIEKAVAEGSADRLAKGAARRWCVELESEDV
jgi:hypothetical protein